MTARACVLALLITGACRPEGDHCEYPTTRCDGDSGFQVCKIGGANDDYRFHRSNYWDRTSCPEGTRCVRVGEEVGCADPATACDATKHVPTVQRSADGTLVVTSCDQHIGTASYLSQSRHVVCDPKTYVRKCERSDAASVCSAASELRASPAVRTALRDYFVEDFRHCSVCGGTPDKCND